MEKVRKFYLDKEKDIIVKDYINGAFKEIIELKEKLERYKQMLENVEERLSKLA